MSGERTYAVLPCADLDDAVRFYGALGFTTTFRQRRPNPYAVVALDDIQIHLTGIEGFDPTASYGSVIVTADELERLQEAFRAGLRAEFGRVPAAGIPRLLPLRRKAGTATGFSIVDAGGNWLRFYRTVAAEDDGGRTGLARVIDVAARQGDARGEDRQAIAVLDAGLLRYPDAPPVERVEALLYRAELCHRIGQSTDDDLAAATTLIRDHQLEAESGSDLQRVREAISSSAPR